jgi:hypothetical protein
MLATHNRSIVLFALTYDQCIHMAVGNVQMSVAQRIIIIFLCYEGENAADIQHRFQL